MNINVIKLNFIRNNNQQAIDIIEKIEKFAKQKNVSINKAITYYLMNYQSEYQKRILSICRAAYPYDGQPFDNLLNKKINESDFLNIKYYSVGNYKKSVEREQHLEDKKVNKYKIGVTPQQILYTKNLNKYTTFNTQILEQEIPIVKRVTKKRKKRIE